MSTLPPPPPGDEWGLDVEDAFGEHDIEYWVWSGNRLVPATPEQVTVIRECEALSRLRTWTAIQHVHAYERVHTQHAGRFTVWLRGFPVRVLPALVARFRSMPPVASDDVPRGGPSESFRGGPNPSQAGTPSDYSASERSAP